MTLYFQKILINLKNLHLHPFISFMQYHSLSWLNTAFLTYADRNLIPSHSKVMLFQIVKTLELLPMDLRGFKNWNLTEFLNAWDYTENK